MYGLEDARLQYEAYRAAAKISPVLQARAELTQKGREWRFAGETLAALTEEVVNEETGEKTIESRYTIVVAGAVVGGMLLPAESESEGGVDHSVIRTMQRDGQLSLHVTSTRMSAGTYVNLAGPASPVVVRAL